MAKLEELRQLGRSSMFRQIEDSQPRTWISGFAPDSRDPSAEMAALKAENAALTAEVRRLKLALRLTGTGGTGEGVPSVPNGTDPVPNGTGTGTGTGAKSAKSATPWELAGISRRTWFRRQAEGRHPLLGGVRSDVERIVTRQEAERGGLS